MDRTPKEKLPFNFPLVSLSQPTRQLMVVSKRESRLTI